MKKNFAPIIFILLFSYSLFAQIGSSKCPLVTVIEPSSAVQSGETLTFSVLIQGEGKNNLEYSWAIDKGVILEGQGTLIIHVSIEGLESETVKATFEIEGLPSSCQNKFEKVGVVAPRIPCGLQESYGKIPFEEESLRLDSFLIELQQNSEYQGFIWIKSDETETIADIKKHIQKLIKHIKYRKVPIDNFTFAVEKSDSHLTTLIHISKFNELPKCENCKILKGSEFK